MQSSKGRKSTNSHAHSTEWHVSYALERSYEHFSTHQHVCYELYLHIANGMFYQLGEQIIPLHPYELIVIAPGQNHGVVSPHALKKYERLIVKIRPELFSKLGREGLEAKRIIDQYCSGPRRQICLTPRDSFFLRSIAENTVSSNEAFTPMERMKAMGCLCVLISKLCQTLCESSSGSMSDLRDHLMQEVHDYIQQRFTEDCSLDTLAAQFNVSKYNLSHRFSETHGISLHQFVLRCRISYAQMLIQQGEPLVNIYAQCGFNDYSSFVRAFVRVVGSNPRDWKKEQKQLTEKPLPNQS